jgi:hypothetical protein
MWIIAYDSNQLQLKTLISTVFTMMLSQTAKERMIKGGRAFFAAAAISACRPDGEPKVPDTIAVGPHLDKIPMGLDEELNSPSSKYPLKGAIAECRGKKTCTIPIYPGSILMDLKFSPEENAHAEIAWMGQQGDWLTFRMRVDFNMRDMRESFQRIPMGESQKLFNTDLLVTPERAMNGTLYLQIVH